MQKRILIGLIFIISVLSLESCVTNYVVSEPILYKPDAKLAQFEQKKLDHSKKELINSFQNKDRIVKAEAEQSLKQIAIAKAIKHAKTIDNLLSEAATYLGTPYRYGGVTRNGIDCSAFVLSVFGAATGMALPRVAAAQSTRGEKVDKESLEKGDLLFFSHGRGRISHVAIVEEVTAEGEVKFIHAATSKGVMISSLNDSYWAPKFRFAKRILGDDAESINMAQN